MAQAQLGKIMSDYAGTYKGQRYPYGRLNSMYTRKVPALWPP